MLEMCLTLSGLIYNAVKDLRSREISIVVTIAYGLAGIVKQIVLGTMTLEFALCMVPGLLALFLAHTTREGVGFGDVWMLFAMGCELSWREMQWVCCVSLGMAAITGLILCTVFHKKKDYEMPFVPFLLLACVLVLVGEHYGL